VSTVAACSRTPVSRSTAPTPLSASSSSEIAADKDVLLDETDDMNDEIDAAYRAKYHRYAKSIVSPEARAATLKLMPR
jgi:hypothetical protein